MKQVSKTVQKNLRRTYGGTYNNYQVLYLGLDTEPVPEIKTQGGLVQPTILPHNTMENMVYLYFNYNIDSSD